MKRFFSIILVCLFVFPLFFPIQKVRARSSLNTAINAQSILDDFTADYLETGNFSGETASPRVALAFNPTNPAEGNRIQAIATPSDFATVNSKLYYTWFLKRDNCPSDKSACDLNKDGRVNIEDYKIEAARTIANGGFNWQSANYSKRDKKIVYDIEGNNSLEDKDSDSESGYDASLGGDGQSASKCYVHDFDNDTNLKLKDCYHLFPNDGISGEKLGDGSFSLKEEKFWHTDPNNKDTAATGNTDEANVIGLGQDSFTWTYASGDKVGVVVEGVATGTTTHVMWALPKNKCNVDDFWDDGDFVMTVSDVNDCLEKNMLSIREGNDSSSLVSDENANENKNTSITYLPKNPFNDPSGKNPEKITFSAAVLDATDNSRIYYNWKIYGSNEKDPADWGDPILKSSLLNASPSSGFGLDKFSFDLAFPAPAPGYLMARITLSENDEDGNTIVTYKEITVPITSISNSISIHSTSANPDSVPGDILILGEERCKENTSNACLVAKNEIIGLEIDSTNLTDFSWLIDDEPLSYPVCPLADCASIENNQAFFPILKNEGETYAISVSAIDKKTKEVIKINRTFQVAQPYALITSSDKTTCVPDLLGYFVDLDNNLTPDYSTTSFKALPGAIINLNSGLSVPAFSNLFWTVDTAKFNKNTASQYGITMDDFGNISFPANTEVGSSFDVSLSTFYTQSNDIKKVLNKYWGVALNDFYEKQIDATITIEVASCINSVDAKNELAQKNNARKILATLAANAPAQFVFLVKIVLISCLLLFSSYFLLSLFPKKDDVY